jgi:hypothetical protein
VFRFNRRKSLSRGMLFYRLIEQALVAIPVTYREVVEPRISTDTGLKELSG